MSVWQGKGLPLLDMLGMRYFRAFPDANIRATMPTWVKSTPWLSHYDCNARSIFTIEPSFKRLHALILGSYRSLLAAASIWYLDAAVSEPKRCSCARDSCHYLCWTSN